MKPENSNHALAAVCGVLAALAAAPASAQSSVTLFGVVDATLARGTGSIANKTQLTNSGYTSSRIGFRGVEDLGGGLSAGFWLEAAVTNDDGSGGATNTNNQNSGAGPTATCTVAGAASCTATVNLNGSQGLTFARRSTLSLFSRQWGELRVGRDYTPQFWNITRGDPFNANGAGTTMVWRSPITGTTSGRASNGIGYFLPENLGGVYGQAQYYLGENPSGTATHNDGTGWGWRLGYAKGAFDGAVSMSRTSYASGNAVLNNIFGSWDFGAVKLMGTIEREKLGLVKARAWTFGTQVDVGAHMVRASLSSRVRDNVTGLDPATRKFAIGYIHNLSKRTALYATWARVNNSGGATFTLNDAVTAANQSSTGLDLGIRHSF